MSTFQPLPIPATGRRPGALLLLFLLLAAAGLLVTGLAGTAAASDPYVGGSDLTRVTRLPAGAAAEVAARAAIHARALGLPAAADRTVERVEDRRGRTTYDEVTDLDARARPSAILRYATDGRLVAAVRLGWLPGTGRPLVKPAAAIHAAEAVARAAGIAPSGAAAARSRGTNGWFVTWERRVDGVPVPGDGLRIQLWPDGTFHGLSLSDHPLAAAPARVIAERAALDAVGRLLDRWIALERRPEAIIDGAAPAWVAPNDTFDAARPDAPVEARRLAWVVRVRTAGSLAEVIRGLEVAIDAGDGSVLGGDVLR